MLNHHHVTRRARRKLALLGAASAAMAVAASPASASVNGSIYANGLNSPGGTVSMGSHVWVSDHVNGFCRLDKNAATGKFTINAATCNTAAASPGQPTFDAATNMVYVPDNSTQGNAVYRLKFNPTTETVSTSAALGTSAIVAGTKPTATALGPDGSLYVGSLGTSLYIAEGGGISEIANAATCTGACAASMTAIVPQTVVNGKVILWETVDIVAAGPDTPYVAKWAPHDFGPKTTIVKYTISTGTSVDHSTSYVAPDGKLQPWTSVTDLALNPAGGLFVSHDPTNGGTNGALVSQIAG